MIRRLQRMDVDVYQAATGGVVPDFTPYGRPTGREWMPPGTWYVPMAQMQKHWVQAMLHEDTYTPFPYFYDVTAWSQPLLCRFNRHGTVDPSRYELGHQVVRLERTPQRLERGIADVRRRLHPGCLISAVRPEVLMCIDDDTHCVSPRASSECSMPVNANSSDSAADAFSCAKRHGHRARLASFATEPNSAAIVVPTTSVLRRRATIIGFAARHRLPVMYPYRLFPKEGGLRLGHALPASSGLHRPHPERGEATGLAGTTAGQVRVGDQPGHRQGARPKCRPRYSRSPTS